MTSSPANRTAWREEENRPAPPSQQVIASAVTGPTPYSRAASTFAPARCRAASSSSCRSSSSRVSRTSVTSSAVATCSCPAGDKWAAAATRSAARPCSVRSVPSPRAGAPWWNKTAWMRCTQAVCSARRSLYSSSSARHSRMWPGGIQHSGSRPSASSIRRCRQSVLSVLACRLRPRANAVPGRLGQMRRDAGRGQLLGDIPPPGAPLGRERDVLAASEPRQPGPQVLPVGRGDLAAPHLPGHGAGIVEGDLLPVDIQPAYDGHRDLLTLRRGARAPCELPTRSIVTRV